MLIKLEPRLNSTQYPQNLSVDSAAIERTPCLASLRVRVSLPLVSISRNKSGLIFSLHIESLQKSMSAWWERPALYTMLF